MEIIAGKTRSNTAAAILSNTTDLENAYVDALNAEGSALKENEKYLDSIQGKIDQFNNAIQTMWSNTLDDSAVKRFVSLGTEIVKLIDNLDLIKTLFIAIGTTYIYKNFGQDLFGDSFKKENIDNIDTINKKLQELKTKYEAARDAYNLDTNSKSKKNKFKQAKEDYELYNESTSSYRKSDELSKQLDKLKSEREKLQSELSDAEQELQDIWSQGESGDLSKEFEEASKKVDNLNVKIDENGKAIQTAEVELQSYQTTTQTLGKTGQTTWNKITDGAKKAGKAIGTMAKSMLVMVAVTTVIELVASGIEFLADKIKNAKESAEEAQEKLEKFNSELSNCESELRNLESQLDNTQEKIEELVSQGPLSYIEQEELERLQAVSAELERQIGFKQTLQGSLQKGANAAAVNATNKYLDTSFSSEESKSERQQKAEETGETIGKAAGLALGAAGAAVLAAKIGGTVGTFFGGPIGTAVGAGIGALIGGIAGKFAGSAAVGAKYDSEETVDEAISNMEENRAKLIEARDKALEAYTKNPLDENTSEAYQEAETELNNYDAAMAKHISQIQANLNAMDWDTASDSQKEFIIEQEDLLDKYNIIMGGENAKSNAILRIFGQEATTDLKNIGQEIQAIVDKGENVNLKEIFGDDQAYAEFEERLNSMTIEIQDVIDYFKYMKVAKDEAMDDTSITDSISKISSLEDAFNSLGDAVKEFKEDGTASASTLKSLSESFGKIEGFEELYKVLATGEGDVEEAITNVANAYIAQKDLLSDLSEEEMQIMVARLKSLGVINAQEVLLNRQTAQQKLDEVLQGYNIDLSAYASAEEAKIAIAQQTKIDVSSIVGDTIAELEAKYGMDLSQFTSVEAAKVKIAKETAKKTAQAQKQEQISALNTEYTNKGYVGNEKYRSAEYKAAKQEIIDNYNATVSEIDAINENVYAGINSIVDSYYNSVAKFDFSGNKTGIGRDFADTIGNGSYENQISLLEAQQTYLQNEIDRMEAEGEQVGKAIYEEQIRLENEKLKLYEQERAALLEQMKTVAKGSDEWYEHANAVWETEHAIQKSTLAIVEYKQAITSLYVEAFSNIEEAFTNLNKLYEYRQNYIRNNIENIELTGGNVSADSYKNLIDIQKESVASYENQIKSLQDTLNQGLADGSIKEGSKEWIDLQFRVYDATLSMQEARNEIENINEELKELYLTAFDKVKEAFDALDDLHSDRQSYVENYMHYMELIGEPIPTSGYEYLIEEENKKLADNMQELYVLREKLADAVNNGNIEVGSEQWIELESNIRDTEAAILDNKIAIEEYNQELKNLYVEAFDKVKDAFGNETNLYDDQQAFIESYIDYLDVIGVKVPTEMYDKLIAIEKQKQQANMQQLEDLRASLANMEANGIGPNDEEWVQAQADIRAVEAAIWDSEKAMAQFNKTIQEMETEKFEEFIKRIGDVVDELENVYDILSDEDVATEDGAWTAEGITSLGLMVQKMEIAQKQIQEYQKEIDKLTDSYKAGEISEQDYNDRLVELKNSQWDAVDAYESAKDAIVDINEARIDMIEEGINKEIEAYEELIDLKKKELDSERDLFEFRKNIKNQTKDIASLERRIAAMSGSTDAATIAERTKLEAQLREAQENLDDTYYSHAMDSQSSAFDDEQEAYVTSKEDYVEMLRETLKDVEQVVTDTMTQVLINADTVLGELNGVSSEYGITLSDSLTTPWINAASQAEAFKNSAIAQQYEFAMQNGIFTGTINGQLDEMFGVGSLAATNFQNGVNANIEAIRLKVETSTSEMTSNLQIPFETALSYAQNTFSPRVRAELQAVADKAKELAPDEETDLITPFKQGTASANTFSDEAEEAIKNVAETAAEYNPTLTEDLTAPPKAGENAWDLFGQKVSDVLSGMVADANTAASSISSSMDTAIAKAKSAVAAIAKAGSSGGNTLNPSLSPPESTLEPPPQEPVTTEKKKTKYHTYIKYANSYYYQCGSDASGKNYSGYYLKRKNKIPYTAKLMAAANETLYYKGGSSGSKMFAFPAFKHPIIYAGSRGYVEEYAKGTLGIKKDQWAIDSEPQFGDELVLVPNKGVLSYMRKGTSVIPSDLTENLIEWGKLNPDMTTLSNGVQNTNLMTNVINKPETNFEFDSLLHIDNCSNEAIPEVRKIVEEQLNKFARNLNYNLKRVGSN